MTLFFEVLLDNYNDKNFTILLTFLFNIFLFFCTIISVNKQHHIFWFSVTTFCYVTQYNMWFWMWISYWYPIKPNLTEPISLIHINETSLSSKTVYRSRSFFAIVKSKFTIKQSRCFVILLKQCMLMLGRMQQLQRRLASTCNYIRKYNIIAFLNRYIAVLFLIMITNSRIVKIVYEIHANIL